MSLLTTHVHRHTDGADVAPVSPWWELLKQIVLVGCAILFYFAVRGATEGAESAAVENGQQILDLEERVGLAWEDQAQSIVTDSRLRTTLSNWAYIWLHWPVIIATLFWLHARHRVGYLLLRNAMFISGAIGLIIFVRFPVAPPRLLPGFTDTVTEYSTSYRLLQPPSLVNKYAAMPSLHVGWNLLVGYALFRASPNRLVKFFAVAGPAAMTVAVVTTANHYVVDAIAGAAVAMTGLFIADRATLRIARRTSHLGPGLWRQRQVIEDQAVDAEGEQPVAGLDVGDEPGEHRSSRLEPGHGGLVEQTAVDDRSVRADSGRQPPQKGQFGSVPRRPHRPDP